MNNVKIFRVGHRNYKRAGCVTIASVISPDDNKIFYGVSFCSPKEPIYFKKMGNDLALDMLGKNIVDDNHLVLDLPFTHPNIVNAIIQDLIYGESTPRYANPLLLEQLKYPTGLHRNSTIRKPFLPININEVVVGSQFAKEQLMLACKYLHDMPGIDTDFTAINELVHLYLNPERIIVREES